MEEEKKVCSHCCGKEHVPHDKKAFIKDICVLIVSLVFLIAGYFDWRHIGFLPFYYVNPSWVAVILSGLPIFVAAANSVKHKKITTPVLISMTMLVSIALEITSFFYDISGGGGGHSHGHSYIFAAGEIAFLMRLGDFIEDIIVAKIGKNVENTADKRASISRTADKLVSYILPSILVVAIIVGLVSGFAFNLSAVDAIIRAAAVLVVFCPCSIALAAPVAIAAGLGNAAMNGALIKNGEILENMSRVTTVCFDNAVMREESAKQAIADLTARGYETVIFTDGEDKAAKISELKEQGKTVLTVINGTHARLETKLADCSVAIGDRDDGTADAVIQSGEISKVAETLKLSKRVILTVKLNIIISMVINVVAVVASFMGWLTPVTGALVHNCTTVYVLLSSILLLYRKKKTCTA